MRKNWKTAVLAGLILSGSLLLSCGDDEEPDMVASGSFTIDGVSYQLGFAYKEDYGMNNNDSFDIDISLTSQEIDLQGDGENLSGLNFVYFDLNTNSENELQTGTYNFSDQRDVLTMVDSFVAFEISTDASGEVVSGTQYLIEDGSVDVSRSGEVFTLRFNLTTEENKVVTGSFTGTLTESN